MGDVLVKSKCEVAGCEEEAKCFHYCHDHHIRVCMNGEYLADIHNEKVKGKAAEYRGEF